MTSLYKLITPILEFYYISNGLIFLNNNYNFAHFLHSTIYHIGRDLDTLTLVLLINVCFQFSFFELEFADAIFNFN